MVDVDSVTVVIPHLPSRRYMLQRALLSVHRQTRPPDAINIAVDHNGEGAATTRSRATATVRTWWVAFLDDDDEFHTHHIETLLSHAHTTGADVIYSTCRVVNLEHDPPVIPRSHPSYEEWGRPGRPFDPELLRRRSYLPITSLVRTGLAQRSRFVAPEGTHYEDWGFYLGLLDLGAKFAHIDEETWTWHHGRHNTSGIPGRGGGE